MNPGLLKNLGFILVFISILVSEISAAIPTESKLKSGTTTVKADDEFSLTNTLLSNWCMIPVKNKGITIACPLINGVRTFDRHSLYNWDSATYGVTPPTSFTDPGVPNHKHAPNFFVPPYFHGFNHTHIITMGNILNGQELLISLEDRFMSGKNFQVTKNSDGTMTVAS